MEAEKKNGSRVNWSLYLRAGLSAGLLALLFWQVNWNDFVDGLRRISPVWLAAIPVLFFLNTAVSSLKWQTILANFGVQERFGALFRTYLISSFFSTFLPSTIGGDGYRFWVLRQKNPQAGAQVASSIVLDRAYGLIVLLAFHFVAALVYWRKINTFPVIVWAEAALFIGTCAGLIALVILWRVRETTLAILKQGLARRVIEKGFEVLGLLGKPSVSTIAISCLLSLVFVLSGNVAWVIYYRSAGIVGEWGFIFYVSTLAGLIAMLPISINGIGLTELVQIVSMGTLGIPQATILLVSLMNRVVTTLLTASGGIVYLWNSLRERR